MEEYKRHLIKQWWPYINAINKYRGAYLSEDKQYEIAKGLQDELFVEPLDQAGERLPARAVSIATGKSFESVCGRVNENIRRNNKYRLENPDLLIIERKEISYVKEFD